jgi:hypothetical protein
MHSGHGGRAQPPTAACVAMNDAEPHATTHRPGSQSRHAFSESPTPKGTNDEDPKATAERRAPAGHERHDQRGSHGARPRRRDRRGEPDPREAHREGRCEVSVQDHARDRTRERPGSRRPPADHLLGEHEHSRRRSGRASRSRRVASCSAPRTAPDRHRPTSCGSSIGVVVRPRSSTRSPARPSRSRQRPRSRSRGRPDRPPLNPADQHPLDQRRRDQHEHRDTSPTRNHQGIDRPSSIDADAD